MRFNKKPSLFMLWLFTVCIAGTGGEAWAQNETEDGQRVRTQEVVVTATKTERELLDVPASMSVVNSDEIFEQGSGTVADALRDVPGVEVYDQSVPGATRVLIRGESASRVLILIDGQKVSEQKSMDGAAILVDPNMIERIEVIKGPASVLHGSEAIGGVVNIITKKGGQRPLQAEAATTYNSATNGLDNYLSAFGAYNGFSYRVSGNYSDQGDRIAGDNTRLPSTSYLDREFMGYLDYSTDVFKIGYSYDNYWSNVNSYTPDGTITAEMPLFQLDLPEWSREKHAGFVEVKDISDVFLKVRLDGYYQSTYKDFRQEMDIDPAGPQLIRRRMKTTNDQDSTGISLQTDWLFFEDHYVIAGFDFLDDSLDASSWTSSTTTFPAPATTIYDYSYKAWQDTYAVYVQDEWSLPADFTLTVGARQTWVDSKLTDSDDPGLANVTRSTTDDHMVFSSGLVWKGVKDLALRALYAQGYRYPNLQQLYIGTTHGATIPTDPNAALKPETSDTFELGARYDDGTWSIDLAGFTTTAKDYITTQLNAAGTRRSFVNVDEANTYGVELAAGYTIAALDLTPYASGTFLRRQFKTSTYSTHETGHPEITGRAGLRYERDFAVTELRYYADLYARFATDARERDSTGVTTKNQGWETLNFGTGVSFGPERQYKISLNVNNILDRKYQVATSSVDDPGRHVVMSGSVSF